MMGAGGATLVAQYTGKSMKWSPAAGNKFILINKKPRRAIGGMPDADAGCHANILWPIAIILHEQTGRPRHVESVVVGTVDVERLA